MRVLTFSRFFPANHPRKGDPTLFVQKILSSLIDIGHISMSRTIEIGKELNLVGYRSWEELRGLRYEPKNHTIRTGNRWKEGDFFSPRIWTGKPYASKQKEFVHPVEIKKVWPFEVDENGVASIDGTYLFGEEDENMLALNDGLSWEDFSNWIIMPCFRKEKAFDGQIICWNPEIEY
jgi:hypothetical protein